MGRQIHILMTDKTEKRDYQYYAQVLKPELKAFDEALYFKVLHKDSILKEVTFGAHERRNFAD